MHRKRFLILDSVNSPAVFLVPTLNVVGVRLVRQPLFGSSPGSASPIFVMLVAAITLIRSIALLQRQQGRFGREMARILIVQGGLTGILATANCHRMIR